MKRDVVDPFGAFFRNLLQETGFAMVMLGGALRSIPTRPFPLRPFIKQLEQAGVRSFSIIFLTGLFTGMVLAYQGAITLERFGGKSLIGNAITASLLKELGPVLAALMVAGRVGAGYASELGTMVVTEQVAALRAFGTDPRQFLVLPRLLALLIMLPLLTVYANAVGLFGGYLVCVYSLDFSTLYYLRSIEESMTSQDVIGGLVKSFVFAGIIATISCSVGLNARGGSEAVGRVTTRAVVISSIMVLFADFLVTRLLYVFQ
ncbi:MAG: ABC transporter permease [Candidatus Dadabacteria bacterium]|nr:MAG: ABC transporter permease [Candidatus Dadabacteria bacterium]